MKKLALLTATLLGASLVPAMGQSTPFDMTPESGLVVELPSQTVLRAPNLPAAEPTPLVEQLFGRYIIPSTGLRLAGEEARQAVTIYLTEAQAAAPASFELAYINAVVVAPEYSSLTLRINEVELGRSSITSSAQPTTLNFSVPQGVLRPGANVVEFSATQRHRTDCSIGSTFELWTDIAPANAQLKFMGTGLGNIQNIADLGAVGADAKGATTLRIITGSLNDARAKSVLLRLTQQLAIALRAPYLHIEQTSDFSAEAAPGTLDLVVMPAAELPAAMTSAQSQAALGPLAAMVQMSSGANTLVVSGPDWNAIGRAGDAIAAAAPGAPERLRVDLGQPNPVLLAGQSVSLAELGVDTVEFNGRRFVSSFQFELPADFYAHRYGTLDMVLDAAFSNEVGPSSEIDIYTNGEIASATPLLRTNGGILRNTVMRIPMTNLRPGRNVVDIEVNLQTASDEVCSPGWTGLAPTRFVLGDSTRLRMPEYARAITLPDLTILTGMGWPYTEQNMVPLALGEGETELGSAMLLLSRIAAASDLIIPVEVVSQSALSPERNAMVVMPLSAMTVAMTDRIGISGIASAPVVANRGVLEQFSSEDETIPAWRRPAVWLSERLGLQLDDLRVRPLYDGPHAISPNTAALSQVRQPEGGVWTILTGADSQAMFEGTERMVVTSNWRQISGKASEVSRSVDEVTTVPVGQTSFINTQPFSLTNLRLVAANWFSSNILYFAAVIMALGIVLMAVTSMVLNKIGRKE